MATIRIETRDHLRTLYIDDAESSAIDLADPTRLEFEYMQHIDVVTNHFFASPQPIRALHLGAAGCALARCFDAQRPRSRQLAIEIDPELASIARSHFDLPSAPALRIRTQDARTTLETNSGTWHVIVRDAFVNGVVPPHLTTVEAYAHCARLIGQTGVYCVNITNRQGMKAVYREVAAASASFSHLAAIADPAIFKKRRYGNVILLASPTEINKDEIDRALRHLPMPASIVGQDYLLRHAANTAPLTDAHIGWASSADLASD